METATEDGQNLGRGTRKIDRTMKDRNMKSGWNMWNLLYGIGLFLGRLR